ncbi:hypothetical protein BV378_07625 [Nostoc sp. RF31YmG]|jgi:sulfite reductase alpha subunit-like flavoprotein|nr:hypothetical protein BV378_07625 [Nostoc sp. RF31YmG]
MAEPTLAQIFGANAAQTSTTVTITKADLTSTGFVASSSNTGESILAAIVAFSQTTLTSTNQASNTDQSVTISDSNDSLTTRSSVTYRRKTKIITFDKTDSGSTFNPGDY